MSKLLPQQDDPLSSAIADWREENSRETLSPAVRGRILSSAADRSRPSGTTGRSLAALFLPVRELLVAGAVPLLLLTAAVSYLALEGVQAPRQANRFAPAVHASKVGDEVMFKIANGARAHSIYRSTAPDRFGDAPMVTTTDGAFSDRLDGGPDLIFYRID